MPEKFDWIEQARQEFRRREEERFAVRIKLEPLLGAITTAEEQLSQLAVFGSEGRYRLARARVEVLEILHSLDQTANSESERNLRASEEFISRGAGEKLTPPS